MLLVLIIYESASYHKNCPLLTEIIQHCDDIKAWKFSAGEGPFTNIEWQHDEVFGKMADLLESIMLALQKNAKGLRQDTRQDQKLAQRVLREIYWISRGEYLHHFNLI